MIMILFEMKKNYMSSKLANNVIDKATTVFFFRQMKTLGSFIRRRGKLLHNAHCTV